jgi:asparagine synthase (glutamine-hydrolysing)
MRDSMAARGPDDATLLKTRNIIFAHRRLAIRDQAGGKQPILSPNGRFVIVYNGEIYNDGDLRDELKCRGYRFSSQCDTEVLAAAWQEWEQDCVYKLRGMFAFGVYDLHEFRLTLVRDRFGIKPLFFTEINGEIVFASTIAAIKRHPSFSAKPNLAAVRHYLSTLRLTLDNQTVYVGIETLRPAEIITFRHGTQQNSIYWSPPESAPTSEMTFAEAVDQLESTLRDSVSMRMVSDVPVGMMLSGGVDSNTLAYMIKDAKQGSFHARCGGGVDPEFPTENSDFEFARDCATQNDLDFEEVLVDADSYQDQWQDLLTQYQTPVSTPSDVIIHKIAANLKRSVGVALGGEGADEACCGYEVPHWSGADFDLFATLGSLEPAKAQTALSSLQQQYGDSPVGSASELYLACNGLIPRQAQRALFRESTWQAADADGIVEGHYDQLFSSLNGMSTAEKTAHVLLKTNLESLLTRLDSATMLASLEARVPYADHVFVEQLFRLPHSYRIDVCPSETSPWRSSLDLANRGSIRPKRLIHAAAERIMPPKLAQRPKCSFSTPVPIWLQSNWKSWISDKLLSSDFASELFRPEAIRQLTQLPPQLSMWNWPIANVILWSEACLA